MSTTLEKERYLPRGDPDEPQKFLFGSGGKSPEGPIGLCDNGSMRVVFFPRLGARRRAWIAIRSRSCGHLDEETDSLLRARGSTDRGGGREYLQILNDLKSS